MPLIRKFLFLSVIISVLFTQKTFAADLKKVGKYKDWEVMVISEQSGKVCFAQSIPVLQAPKKNKRDARLFVTFRQVKKFPMKLALLQAMNLIKIILY